MALSRRAPKTYGELRKMLAELGDPWSPDPTVSDDEPLPEFPTGGDGEYEPSDRTVAGDALIALLKAQPPSNPELRAVWRDEGLLAEGEGGSSRARAKRSSRKRTPPPDQGG
jgi:hypothetical protein